MDYSFEPTLIPYKKNIESSLKVDFSTLNFSKSKIHTLSLKEGFNPNLLFLAATCITLTKFTNTPNIFINTKFMTDTESKHVSLYFCEKNRNITVYDYINKLSESMSDSSHSPLIQEPHFNYIFNDYLEDENNMSLMICEQSHSYSLKLKFDANKYNYSYIHSFLRSIKKVLNHFCLNDISMLKINEIALRNEDLVSDFKLKRNPLVNELLEAQARKTPDKIALHTCGEIFTYKQVNDESNRVANSLIDMGVHKGSSIALMLPRGKSLITTFLGIIKAGCVAVPIDPEYPIERINYVIENSQSEYIVTYDDRDDAINPDDLARNDNSDFPKVSLQADDSIFMLYTSGSTGTPKGVVLTHKGISNLISTHIKTNYKRLLSISSIAFDISEEDILVALTNEIELVFANDDEIKDIILLSNLIEKTRPEFVNITPSRLLSYIKVPEFAKAIKLLKGIGAGGEQFTKNIFTSIKKYADIDIYNGYGPLETSLTSNIKKIENPDFISNGRPLLNYITDVRDIDGKLLPYGVIGELYIGGVGVSKGYYNLYEKTKEVFVSINGVSYYKSGDYAIQLPSGEIIIRGRADNQIKLRGQRVDLEEIEQTILKYPLIDNAVVIVQEINHENHLCAYFISKVEIDAINIKEYLSERLSKFMVPTYIMQLDKFPETPNGKTDRKMLPKPVLNTENERPINNFEKRLYNFCCDILNYQDFGVTDNLFKIGFTSLTVMKLNSDIFHEFNIILKHTDLMNNPTIRQISKLLVSETSYEKIKKIMPSQSDKYPMSSQQKRLYVLYRKNPDLTNYNLPNLRKTSDIDIKKLENAVNKVIDGEEILRTSFHIENGEYMQKIHHARPIHVDKISVNENEDINEILKRNISPFNLEKEALLRIKIIKFNGENYIFRDMHHIIADQISNDILYEKIRNAYFDMPFSPSHIQYKDYTFWVKNQQFKEANYWKCKEISDTGTELFTDYKRPQIQTFNGNKISHKLDKKAIEHLAKTNSTTVYKLLLSQFIVLLHKYSGETNIQIGTVTSGRTHPDLEETLGMFVNTLPFVQVVSGEYTLKDTLIETEKQLSDLFENQNYSIEQIIEDHALSTNNSYNPLFNIAFIQNTDDEFRDDIDWNETKFDFTCKIKNSLSDLIVEFDYNTDLYSFEKISAMLNHYIHLIDNFEKNLDKKIRDVRILSDCEEEKLLEIAGINHDTESFDILKCLKNQIKQNPGKIILSDDNTNLTYKEFNLKSNSLANYLLDNFNVSPQDNIVVIAERSLESVIAFYSIVKLNAVYVPINPLSPKNRISQIIHDVNAKIVLTSISLDLNFDIVDLRQNHLYEYDYGDLKGNCKENLAIIHTSGTTGVPKGVQITYENINNFLFNAQNNFYDSDMEVFYHSTNIGFDTSLFEILFPILNSIRLHVIGEDYSFSMMPENVSNLKSMINTTPSKLKMFFTLDNFDKIMKNVSMLILAGEPLSRNLVCEIQNGYGCVIYNAYGPCEATVFASIKLIESPDHVTIGKSNINTNIYILNNEKQLCPIGIPGEICISGKQVAKGYLNKTENDLNFIENPFGEDILYCTGDLAFWDYNGEINFIGRADSQVKINGQRIELEEINRLIEKNEDISQAITVTNSTKTKLFSYIVSNQKINVDNLLNDLRNNLLPFMVPVSLTQIDEIPLNNNGKIDVKKLPEAEVSKNSYVPPSTRIEKAIVNIWQKILEIYPIGINDDFYNLGGDSIKAIRIVSLLQNEGIDCTPGDIFNYKTPYLIAQNADKSRDVSYDATQGVIDLLPIQSYFFDKINRDNFAQDTILKSKITLDCELLQKAFDRLSDVHDMLRARFRIQDGKAIQEILPLKSRICEINEFHAEDNLEESFIKILRDANSSMDISEKLIDVSLLHNGHECYVIFVIHHLIIDGVSWSILLEDLTQIYLLLLNNKEINIIKPYPYKYWIEEVRHLAERISDEEKKYWIQLNNLLDESEIKGNARFFSFTIKNVEWRINNKLKLSEEEFLALAIARSYKKTYGIDIIFNRESHGRDETLISNINRTVGWFTVQYPVAVEVSPGGGHDILVQDAVNIKERFGEIEHLGLNYSSLAYTLNEFEFKYCPVTFNFLSSEFVFKNDLFESIGVKPIDDKVIESLSQMLHYGVDLNIYKENKFYLVKGRCATGTYLDDKFDEFVDNIKKDLKFINDYLNDG